jgi:hypothetical protein
MEYTRHACSAACADHMQAWPHQLLAPLLPCSLWLRFFAALSQQWKPEQKTGIDRINLRWTLGGAWVCTLPLATWTRLATCCHPSSTHQTACSHDMHHTYPDSPPSCAPDTSAPGLRLLAIAEAAVARPSPLWLLPMLCSYCCNAGGSSQPSCFTCKPHQRYVCRAAAYIGHAGHTLGHAAALLGLGRARDDALHLLWGDVQQADQHPTSRQMLHAIKETCCHARGSKILQALGTHPHTANTLTCCLQAEANASPGSKNTSDLCVECVPTKLSRACCCTQITAHLLQAANVQYNQVKGPAHLTSPHLSPKHLSNQCHIPPQPPTSTPMPPHLTRLHTIAPHKRHIDTHNNLPSINDTPAACSPDMDHTLPPRPTSFLLPQPPAH